MATEIVTDPLRTILFKLEFAILIFATIHTTYFTFILLKLKTFSISLTILCLYLSVPIYCNIVTRIWIITSYLWAPQLQENMSMIQAIHSASASYFEVIIIWIIVERVLFISRVGKRRNISAKAKAIICCTVVVSYLTSITH